MANTSRPFGFRPNRYLQGNPWNGQAQTYGFSASETHDTYKGDLVQLDTTNRTVGLTDPFLPMVPVIKPVQAALTTNAFRGVVAGFYAAPEYNMTATASLGTLYRPGSTGGVYAWVVDDVMVIFEAEESGNSYTSASNNGVNKVVDITYTAGSKLSGIAKVKPDATTVVTNAVKPFRILRYTERVDNFGFASTDTNSFAHLDLLMNNSDIFGAATGTITGA